MKNKVISLTKVFLKNSFQNTQKTNKKTKSKSMIILYIFTFLYLAGLVGFLSYSIIQELIVIKQEQVFLGVILLGVAFFALIQSIFSAMSLLYYSKDNDVILPLPIKPSQILMAKTNVLLLTQYVIVGILGLVPLTLYGLLTSAGIMYYISMLLVAMIFPILPILISSILVLIVMSFSKFAKNKNRFQLIATLISIALVFAATSLTSSNTGSQEELIELFTKANGLVNSIRGSFPTLGMAIDSLTANNILEGIFALAKLIITTGIIYILYLAIGQKLYLKGLVGNSSSGKKTKKKLNVEKAFRKSSLAKTYIGKEIKTLMRNSVFFMQCVLPAILFPIIMTFSAFMGMKSEAGEAEISNMIASIPDKTTVVLGLAILGAIQFFSMFMYISITAISRDGQNAVFMKYIPVLLKKQLFYKIMPNILFTSFMSVLSLGIAQYIFNMPIAYLILIGIAAIAMGGFRKLFDDINRFKKTKTRMEL